MKNNLQFKKKAFALYAGFFSCLSIFTFSCKERTVTDDIFIPPVDNINTFESSDFEITSKSFLNDSLWTNDYSYMLASIGSITNDPYFGKSYAGLYFQVNLPFLGFKFGTNPIIDSSIVTVPYYMGSPYIAYGDTTSNGQPMRLNAYRITGDFEYEATKLYFAKDSVAYNPTPISSGSFRIRDFKDTVVLANGDTLKNVLRMKMSNAFTQEVASAADSVYQDNATFKEFMKGFYIAPDYSQPGTFLGLFRLDGGAVIDYGMASLTFFYRNAGDTLQRKAQFRFASAGTSFFNKITRSHNGYPAAQYLNNLQKDSIAIQGFPGIASDITIDLQAANIPKSIINKATLQLTTLKVGLDDVYTPPTQLIMVGVDENGEEYAIADRLNQIDSLSNLGMAFVGGIPKVVTEGTETYIKYDINIPREVQRLILAGKTKLTLRIYATTAYAGFFRMVADGQGGSANTKAKFNVIYSLK